MKKEIALKELSRYEKDLKGILSRFTRDNNGIHIKREDDPPFRQMTIELKDLFIDMFGTGNSYSNMVVSHFNDGISCKSQVPPGQSVTLRH